MEKQGRNEICQCGSGRKFKRCCIALVSKERKPINPKLVRNPKAEKFLKKVIGSLSQGDEPLRIFCKEEGFYYFRGMTVGNHLDILKKLENDLLVKDDFLNIYKKHTTKEYLDRILLSAYCDHIDALGKRRDQIRSTVEAHFNGEYCLSIISFFVLIEGVLRDIGGLKPKDKIKPTIPREGHEEEARYHDADAISYFSAFITKLFEGSAAPDEFNRNTILHGFNLKSFSEENSLILLLTLLEIGYFVWNEKNYMKMILNQLDMTRYMPSTPVRHD